MIVFIIPYASHLVYFQAFLSRVFVAVFQKKDICSTWHNRTKLICISFLHMDMVFLSLFPPPILRFMLFTKIQRFGLYAVFITIPTYDETLSIPFSNTLQIQHKSLEAAGLNYPHNAPDNG